MTASTVVTVVFVVIVLFIAVLALIGLVRDRRIASLEQANERLRRRWKDSKRPQTPRQVVNDVRAVLDDYWEALRVDGEEPVSAAYRLEAWVERQLDESDEEQVEEIE